MAALNIGSGPDYRPDCLNLDRYLESSHHRGETSPPDVLGDAHHLPFRDGLFETVHVIHVLEHLNRPLDALLEIRRVTAPDGRIHLEVPDASLVSSERADHLYSWTQWSLPNLITDCGLAINRHETTYTSNGPTQVVWCSLP